MHQAAARQGAGAGTRLIETQSNVMTCRTVAGMPRAWLTSASVPNPAYLRWLLLSEFMRRQDHMGAAQIPLEFVATCEYNVLLHQLDMQPAESTGDETPTRLLLSKSELIQLYHFLRQGLSDNRQFDPVEGAQVSIEVNKATVLRYDPLWNFA